MTKAEYLKLQECVRNLEERIKIHEELNDDNNMYINHLEEENEELRSIIYRKGYAPYRESGLERQLEGLNELLTPPLEEELPNEVRSKDIQWLKERGILWT